jgi:hypothetical protein
MLVFDIPLHAPDGGDWVVALQSGETRTFPSRSEAVKFAAKEVMRASAAGIQAYLSIQGDDGKWRLFGPDLKAPNIDDSPAKHRGRGSSPPRGSHADTIAAESSALSKGSGK